MIFLYVIFHGWLRVSLVSNHCSYLTRDSLAAFVVRNKLSCMFQGPITFHCLLLKDTHGAMCECHTYVRMTEA